MKCQWLVACLCVVGGTSVAAAQETDGFAELSPASLDWELSETTDDSFDVDQAILRDGRRPRLQDPFKTGTSFGLRAGFLKNQGADNGTWLGGIQVRTFLMDLFAIEAAVSYHQSSFEDGDALVATIAAEAGLLIFPIPSLTQIRPYAILGVGAYLTSATYSDSLNAVNSGTSAQAGEFIGVGAMFKLGPSMSLNSDIRYLFLKGETVSPASGVNVDLDGRAIQFTIGLNFGY